VHFNNEATALEADLLIVCTPATLDNWIIADLREPLKQRSEGKQKAQPKPVPNPSKFPAEKSQISNGGLSAFSP
jgi:hypothetical protein